MRVTPRNVDRVPTTWLPSYRERSMSKPATGVFCGAHWLVASGRPGHQGAVDGSEC